MKYTAYLIIVYGLFLSSCSHEEKTVQIDELIGRIDGEWHYLTDNDTGIESWKKQNDSSFSCYSFLYNGADTLQSERISLSKVNGKWQYCPEIYSGGRKIQVTCFNADTFYSETVRFMNSRHDFPQYIEYRFIRKDSMYVRVGGKLGNTERSFQFKMVKQKP